MNSKLTKEQEEVLRESYRKHEELYPYFAKYLPVEGKVEIGDKFIDTGVINFIGTRRNKEGVYDYQKVKPFLCSRGIQVGDEVQNGDNEICKIPNEKDLQTALKNGFFKVIGEISPDATYVTEGDEFDKEDIQFYVFHKSAFQGFTLLFEEWEKMDKPYYSKYVRIKGPCGHFH